MIDKMMKILRIMLQEFLVKLIGWPTIFDLFSDFHIYFDDKNQIKTLFTKYIVDTIQLKISF